MGKKQTWQRKLFFIHLAGFLIIFAGLQQGCQPPNILKGNQSIRHAKLLMASGDYESSVRLYEETLQRFPQTHGDTALFQTGLIYAYPDNPNRNYQKSLQSFQELLQKYPSSNFKDEAAVLSSLIQQIHDKDAEINKLQAKTKYEQTAKLEKSKNMNKLEDKIANSEKKAADLTRQIKNLKAQIEQYKKQAQKFKEVDLEIEKLKREK
jgi:outer membrane protein assembly factor BamD (BamD/ComL family)